MLLVLRTCLDSCVAQCNPPALLTWGVDSVVKQKDEKKKNNNKKLKKKKIDHIPQYSLRDSTKYLAGPMA